MSEIISYKGKYGTVSQTVSYNDVDLPNIMITTIYTGYHKPKVGEEVYLSSCEIPYHNNYENSWTTKPSDDELFSIAVLELVSYDDSNYESGKSRNGGKYLESIYVIRSLVLTRTFSEIMD